METRCRNITNMGLLTGPSDKVYDSNHHSRVIPVPVKCPQINPTSATLEDERAFIHNVLFNTELYLGSMEVFWVVYNLIIKDVYPSTV